MVKTFTQEFRLQQLSFKGTVQAAGQHFLIYPFSLMNAFGNRNVISY